MDARDLVYADERAPIDLYRTILRMDDDRRRIFADLGGSLIVLSPLGSKVLAIGALMAALERDFTVMYVETREYSVDLNHLATVRANEPKELMHVWLRGEVYGQVATE